MLTETVEIRDAAARRGEAGRLAAPLTDTVLLVALNAALPWRHMAVAGWLCETKELFLCLCVSLYFLFLLLSNIPQGKRMRT